MFISEKMGARVIESLRQGGLGVLPTDTIYGISCSASNREAVKRAGALRGREGGKRFIVLIADPKDVEVFGVRPDEYTREFLRLNWPGKVSVEFPIEDAEWEYLHLGTGSFAMRTPDVPELRDLLRATGPLISTSVNPPGKPPAKNIAQAMEYFPDLDFYVDRGELDGSPSTLVALEKGDWRVIRQGAAKLRFPDGSGRRRMIK